MTQAAILAASGSPFTTPSFKNRIINGNMVISQRNGTSSITSGTNGTTSLDRWGIQNNSGASRFTVQQNAGSVTPPTGFSNYLGVTSTSAYAVGATDVCGIYQNIEGFNTADLNWGTANAKSVSVSFWVYSSLTGTFSAAIKNSGDDYSYLFNYTISSASTWTYITQTIPGPTAGTWIGATNGIGVKINFNLGTGSSYSGTAGSWVAQAYYATTGSVSVVGTNNATWYVTGVQIESGTTATNFDFRSIGTEFMLCQRYYQRLILGNTSLGANLGLPAFNYIATLALAYYTYPIAMRTTPSLITTGSASNYQVLQNGGSVGLAAAPTGSNISTTIMQINFSTAGGLNLGQGSAARGNNASDNDFLAFSAEL
jgi:hypothetical protein